MIRNLLFDMGGVIVRWDPHGYINDMAPVSEEDRILLFQEVYGSTDWVMLDRGAIDEAEMIRRACTRLPQHLHPYVEKLTCHWSDKKEEVAGMYDLVKELSEKGYQLYLFTNAAPSHHQYFPGYRAAEFFQDRIMLSSDYQILKPDPAFFTIGMKKFSLKPEECLYTDDNALNTECAVRLGIRSFVFYGEEKLRRNLREAGVDC